jgi:hypothetical protein
VIVAIKNNDVSLVENLINAGTNVNSRDVNHVTALALAAGLGRTEIVKILLARGEEVKNSAPDALLHAVIGGHPEIVQMLLDYGASINIKDGKYGRTTLMWAVIGKNPEIIKMLFPYVGPYDINAKSNVGYTPLIIAVQYESLEALKILLTHPDIDINIKDKNNKTALDIAKLLYEMGKLSDIEIIAELHSRENSKIQAIRTIKNSIQHNKNNLLVRSVRKMGAFGPNDPGGIKFQDTLGKWENRNMESHDINVNVKVGGKRRRTKTNKKKQKNKNARKSMKSRKLIINGI